jgi:Uma2 family endonuclease
MSTITAAPERFGSPWPPYRMPLEQYEAMVESGIFTERDRLQLINGLLVAKVTQGDDHCAADDLSRVALERVVPAGWYVRPNKPLRLPPDGCPEPDEAVVRGSIRDYVRGGKGMPGAQDVALVVEIAQSSLAADREMTRVYGPAGIPFYWIVNLVDRQVEVYSGPRPDGYGKRDIYRSGEDVPVVVDGTLVGRIAVDDLLP